MTEIAGHVFGLIGALAAMPRRLAEREVARLGGQLRRGVTRRTSQVVFGRTLLFKADEATIVARFDAAQGRQRLSELSFLRRLGLLDTAPSPTLTRRSLIDRSGLSAHAIDLLSLFDAFEQPAEPYSFRDLILARKYAGLLAGGATWNAIARSIHRAGGVASLTAQTLHFDGGASIFVRQDTVLSELDGQMLLDLETNEPDIEELFTQAEVLEANGQHAAAATLYLRCLGLDPADSVAAFNRGNCLRAAGEPDEAALEYARALQRDPGFVEAWFNLAGLMRDAGRLDAARRHLLRAIEIDAEYADGIFNLASLEYDADNLAEARRWWARYLELDSGSDWARLAARGVQFVDQRGTQGAGG